LRHLADLGVSAAEVRAMLWESLGQQSETWNWNAVPRTPWMTAWGDGKS
jgi:hypothetical protein